MFVEVLDTFRIDLSTYKTLSRCVKCNSPDLIIIGCEEAMKDLTFKHEDKPINTFWRCGKCNQIYWEGGQFVKAKAKYEQFRK